MSLNEQNMDYNSACNIISTSRNDPSPYSRGDINEACKYLKEYFQNERDIGKQRLKLNFSISSKQREQKKLELMQNCKEKKAKLSCFMDEIRLKLPNKGRKARITQTLRKKVWCKTFSSDKGEAPCFCCEKRIINCWNFQAGHVQSEYHGGPTIVENLRPICAECNQRMGTKNMYQFMLDNGFRCDKFSVDDEYAIGYDCGFSEEE